MKCQVLLNFDHIYLLGWFSPDGKINLTRWEHSLPLIDIAVQGATDDDMKKLMWNAYVPPNKFELLLWPNNGIHAFGWRVEQKIRRAKSPPEDEWAWYYRIKGLINV
jgi:hypothetical protein